MRRTLAVWLVGLSLAFGGFAWAEDAGTGGGDAPKRPFRDRAGMGQQGQGRPHRDFVVTLQAAGFSVTCAEVVEALHGALLADV